MGNGGENTYADVRLRERLQDMPGTACGNSTMQTRKLYLTVDSPFSACRECIEWLLLAHFFERQPRFAADKWCIISDFITSFRCALYNVISHFI